MSAAKNDVKDYMGDIPGTHHEFLVCSHCGKDVKDPESRCCKNIIETHVQHVGVKKLADIIKGWVRDPVMASAFLDHTKSTTLPTHSSLRSER